MKWVAIPFSRDPTQVSCIAGRFFTFWAIREATVFSIKVEIYDMLGSKGAIEARHNFSSTCLVLVGIKENLSVREHLSWI